MASLYKRATPSQARILRAVEGAVKNTMDAHPGASMTPRLARSIAKRAAGTLSAQWPEVLAAKAKAPPSVRAGETPVGLRQPASLTQVAKWTKGRGVKGTNHSPLKLLKGLHKEIGKLAGLAKRAGEKDHEKGLVAALRIIGKEIKAHEKP